MGKTKTAKIDTTEKKKLSENEAPHDAKASRGLREPKARSKKYTEAKLKIDKTKQYSLPEAIDLVKATSYSKFDGTMEAHLTVKKEGLAVQVVLPYQGGKAKKIEVASDETIKKLQAGKVDFDVLLATADMMPKLVAFARILGPKGLMPNPKNGTLIKSKEDAKRFSGNTITVKTEKTAPLIHVSFGKVSQKENELEENLNAILKGVGKKQIVKGYIKATMSPSVRVSIS